MYWINYPMNTKQIGIITETKFVFECSKLGLTVSQPIGDNAPYDFIVDFNGILKRIQCKNLRKSGLKYIAETNKKTGHKRDTKVLYKGLCDYFFLYNIEDDKFAFIDVDKCSVSVTLWSSKDKSESDSRIRFIEDYNEIKNNCELEK